MKSEDRVANWLVDKTEFIDKIMDYLTFTQIILIVILFVLIMANLNIYFYGIPK